MEWNDWPKKDDDFKIKYFTTFIGTCSTFQLYFGTRLGKTSKRAEFQRTSSKTDQTEPIKI